MNHRFNKTSPVATLKRRILSWPTLLFFAVAVAFIYFLATRFDLDWAKTWSNVRDLDPWLYIVAFVMYYLSFLFRGLRWHILARNSAVHAGQDIALPSSLTFARLIVAGWFVNSITWFRLGDAYRAYAFSERSGGGFSWSLGTILAERVMDMLTVVVLLFVSAIAFSASWDSGASRYMLIAASVMAAALIGLLAAMRVYGARLARLLPSRLEGAYHRFQIGTLGSLKQLPALFILSTAGWALEASRLYFVVAALDLSISLPLIVIVALGHAILSTVPTPGGVGAVEPGVTGLLVLSLARHDAVSVALVDRSITYLSVIAIGGLIFLLLHLSSSRRANHEPSVPVHAEERERVAHD